MELLVLKIKISFNNLCLERIFVYRKYETWRMHSYFKKHEDAAMKI